MVEIFKNSSVVKCLLSIELLWERFLMHSFKFMNRETVCLLKNSIPIKKRCGIYHLAINLIAFDYEIGLDFWVSATTVFNSINEFFIEWERKKFKNYEFWDTFFHCAFFWTPAGNHWVICCYCLSEDPSRWEVFLFCISRGCRKPEIGKWGQAWDLPNVKIWSTWSASHRDFRRNFIPAWLQ